MGKFDGFLICSDVDSTLTYEAGKVSDENAKAIKYFQDEGGLFTLATGRAPSFMEHFSDKLKINAPIVSFNGTLLYDTGKDEIIKTWPMEKAVVYKIFKYLQETYPEIWHYSFGVNTSINAQYEAKNHRADDGTLDALFDSFPDEMYKVLTVQSEPLTLEIKHDLIQKFGDKLQFYRSWNEGLEYVSLESGKGIAVDYLKKHLKGQIHTTVGVGDYENDITLIEYADIGYAVENSIDEVKKAADRITVKNTENAIAAVIKDLEETVLK
ncbi:MAG: HAD family hydrolase [Eubacterium sp.]|nr:HAD family hydrolase [Eubacterium sp.]